MSGRHIGKGVATTLRRFANATEAERRLPVGLFEILDVPILGGCV
jgi:hypothetical protein